MYNSIFFIEYNLVCWNWRGIFFAAGIPCLDGSPSFLLPQSHTLGQINRYNVLQRRKRLAYKINKVYVFLYLHTFNGWHHHVYDLFFKTATSSFEIFPLLVNLFLVCKNSFFNLQFQSNKATLFCRVVWDIWIWTKNGCFNRLLSGFITGIVICAFENNTIKHCQSVHIHIYSGIFGYCFFFGCARYWALSALGNESKYYCF